MSHPSRLLRVAGVLAAVFLAASPATAQSGGSVRGTVTASDNKSPIPGAHISVTNPERVAIASERGAYTLRDLPAGTYDILVTAVGREPSHNTVTVKGGAEQTLDVSLKPGSILLSSVVVSASNMPTEAKNVSATVNTLTAEQVKTSPARETQDMLREIPGVELPRTSSQVGGTAQIVSIRGVDEGRTAVLLDGIPLNDAWGEWIDWSRAPKGSIDRVEVLEGGGANLYGNGAMGGVISMFSRPITPYSYHIVADGGNRDERHMYGSFGVPIVGPLSLGLTGDYGDGGGYKMVTGPGSGPIDTLTPSTSTRRNLIGRLEYAPSPRFSAFVSDQTFSEDRNLGTPLTTGTRKDNATDLGLNYGESATGYLTVRAWNRVMREDQTGSSLSAVAGVNRALERKTSFAHIPTVDRGAGISWSRQNIFGFQSIGAGGDYRYMDGSYAEQDFANNTANAPTTTFNSGGNQSLSGLFVTGVLAPVEPLHIELSAREDRWGNNDGVFTDATGTTHFPDASRSAFSPRVGAKYQVSSSFALRAAFYQAFRAPNLAELYRRQVSSTTITIPNPALKPEFATGYEAGFDFQPARWVQLKGTVYRANYSDFNTFVTTPPPAGSPAGTPSTRMRENVQDSRSQGAEAYFAIRPIQRVELSGSYEYDDDRVSNLGPVAPSATVFVGARIGRVPAQKATARASYDSPMLGTWVLMGRYEGTNTTLGNSFTLPSFRVYDASVTKDIMWGVSVFASLENIFDAKYDVSLGVTGSGASALSLVTLGLPRTFRLGIDAVRF